MTDYGALPTEIRMMALGLPIPLCSPPRWTPACFVRAPSH
jgi:hypothetical protein